MSNTTSVHMINLEVVAQDNLDRDTKAGTTAGKDYSWHGTMQTIPVGMYHAPESYAQGLRMSLPHVNTIRIVFNSYSFNPDGSLHPEFERFLTEAVKQNFKIVFNYGDHETQVFDNRTGLTIEEMRSILTGSSHDRFVQGWDDMFDWLDAHPDVKANIYGLEGMNEPQAYSMAHAKQPDGEFVRLYGDHMVEFAQMMKDRIDAKIMVSAMGFGQNFQSMANATASTGTGKVLDQIRTAAGDDLVWSTHLYPHWYDVQQSLEGVEQFIKREFSILGDDDVILTETAINNLEANTLNKQNAFWISRAWEAFTDAGIGIGWFAGASFGPASFVNLVSKSSVQISHPDSYASGLNAYTLGTEDPAFAAGQVVTPTLIKTKVIGLDGKTIANMDGLALGLGYGGNDTITGIDRAMNLLYGGTGNDILHGHGMRDQLFGQAGNDTIYGLGGDDVIQGGHGDDKLYGGTGSDVLSGGKGADLFSFDDGGKDIVGDYSAEQGDKLMIGGHTLTSAEMTAAITMIDADSDGKADDASLIWQGNTVIMLNYGVARPNGIIDGTDGHDTIRSGYKDAAGEVLTWKGGVIDGGMGNDSIVAGSLSDTVIGGAGNDTVNGFMGNDTVYGGDGDDVAYGWEGNDLVYGDGGNDKLIAGGGVDTLYGGTGNDNISATSGSSTMYGEDGNDIISISGGNAHSFGGIGNDTLSASSGASTLLGQEGDDKLTASGGTSLLYGGIGNDSLSASSGTTTLKGEDGDDRLSSSGGVQILDGGIGNDTISVTSGTTTILAGSGNDVITTGSSLSVVDGGAGQDTMTATMSKGVNINFTGGADADMFEFKQTWANGASNAVIHDFEAGVDSIKLDSLLGINAIMKAKSYESMTNVGDDCVLKFAGDTYTFKDIHIAELLA